MAKNDNLKDFVTDVADAIRAKKGTSDLINPQDFAEEISAISSGSSGESGGSNWKYFDASEMEQKLGITEFGAMLIKIQFGEVTNIMSSAMMAVTGADGVIAFAVELSGKTSMTGELVSFGELITDSFIEGMKSFGVFEITEAEFYNLNA